MKKFLIGALALTGVMLMNGCATPSEGAGAGDDSKAMAEKAMKAAEEAKADAAAAKGMAQDAMNAAQEAAGEARTASEKADRMFKQSMRK